MPINLPCVEDDEAYLDVGPLPMLTRDEITAKMDALGATRIITAEFRVDTSDCQTDYFGSRTSREIIIGFGTGKRESFKQLRTTAAQFPPTEKFAPGYDRYNLRLVWDHNFTDDRHRSFIHFTDDDRQGHPMKGHSVPWHFYNDQYSQASTGYGSFKFDRKAELDEFIAKNPPLNGTEWHVGVESIEHRENYSMGGGNYLGLSRYSGWIVSSSTYLRDKMEFFEPVQKIVKSKQATPKTAQATPPAQPTTIDLYAANL